MHRAPSALGAQEIDFIIVFCKMNRLIPERKLEATCDYRARFARYCLPENREVGSVGEYA
jgi:hypothetical protein